MLIASALLPKMALFKDLESANVNLIELWYEAEKAGQSDVWKKGIFMRLICVNGRKQEPVTKG